MTPARPLALLAVAALLLGAAPKPEATSCAARLQRTAEDKALAEVKLEDEQERADAQAYLIRLELNVTKQRLASALSKCGEACKAP